MSDQLFEDGKVAQIDGHELECVAVSHQELEPGVRSNFVYSFKLKSEVDAEREAAAKAEAERQAAEEAAQASAQPAPEIEANSTEPGSVETAQEVAKPEEPKEETQYVK